MNSAAATGEFAYRIRWRGGGAHPGNHPSRWHGGDGAFRHLLPFWQRPDAARIDVRRSLVDPYGQVMVRLIEQRGSIDLVVLADLSRSMQAGPGPSRLAMVADLLQAAAFAAGRAGDRIGFVGFDEMVREEFVLPVSRQSRQAAETAAALRRLVAVGRSAAGMSAAAERMPARRALVLLASDFLLPLAELEVVLRRLVVHDVQPIVLHVGLDALPPPRHGLLRLCDAESGGTRLLLMRPSLQRRWLTQRQVRRGALDRLFRRYARPAFHAAGRLDLERLSLHLAEG